MFSMSKTRSASTSAEISPTPFTTNCTTGPYPPSAHGHNAGWTKGDKEFLIYDRFDIWLTDPNGRKAPVNITEGIGRETETRFRYVRLDPEEQALVPKADLLLSGFNLKTKAMGYYRDRIESTDQTRSTHRARQTVFQPPKSQRTQTYSSSDNPLLKNIPTFGQLISIFRMRKK